MSNINNLSDAELERLSILMEEMAESQQMISKVIRFRYLSHHPKDINKITNKERLEEELGHVLNIINMICNSNDLDYETILKYKKIKENTIKSYLAYN